MTTCKRQAMWLVLPAALVAIEAYADKPQIQWNPDYDFSAVETYEWQAPPGTSLEQADPFMHTRIVTAIEYELANAGLTKVEQNPDLLVTYYASKDRQVRLESDSYGYGFGGYGSPAWGYYGYGMAGPVSTTTRVVEYDEGTLVVDMWDAEEQELVWRGTVTGILITDNPQKTQKNVVKAIEAMGRQSQKLRSKAEKG